MKHTEVSGKQVIWALFLTTNSLTGLKVYPPEAIKHFEEFYDGM